MIRASIAAIILAASGFAAQDSPPALSSDGEGGLRKDGKPFRAIGVNYFSCFYRTLLDGADTSYEQGFEVLAREQIPFVRFAAMGFWPKDMALYRTDREEYFQRFDVVVAYHAAMNRSRGRRAFARTRLARAALESCEVGVCPDPG